MDGSLHYRYVVAHDDLPALITSTAHRKYPRKYPWLFSLSLMVDWYEKPGMRKLGLLASRPTVGCGV